MVGKLANINDHETKELISLLDILDSFSLRFVFVMNGSGHVTLRGFFSCKSLFEKIISDQSSPPFLHCKGFENRLSS